VYLLEAKHVVAVEVNYVKNIRILRNSKKK
jgi:hypothetical protein